MKPTNTREGNTFFSKKNPFRLNKTIKSKTCHLKFSVEGSCIFGIFSHLNYSLSLLFLLHYSMVTVCSPVHCCHLCSTPWQWEEQPLQKEPSGRGRARCQSSWCQRWGASPPSCWWSVASFLGCWHCAGSPRLPQLNWFRFCSISEVQNSCTSGRWSTRKRKWHQWRNNSELKNTKF